MKECPVCGFNPEQTDNALSPKELQHNRILNIFAKNGLQHWWTSQPKFICSWLKSNGLEPKSILDIGCGDGRWVPAILETWPKAQYVGIDRMEDHYFVNNERMPDIENVKWELGDVVNYEPKTSFDTILIAGTLNPKMQPKDQVALFNKVHQISPISIICLFDLDQTGEPPDAYLKGHYKMSEIIKVPILEQSVGQDLIVWLYEKNGKK